MWKLLSGLFRTRTQPQGLRLNSPAQAPKPSSVPVSPRTASNPKVSESDLRLLAIMEAKDREIDQTMAKPLEAQLDDLRAYRSRDGAHTFASRLGRLGERHTNANGFRLLMRVYRESTEAPVVKILPQILVQFDLSLLETEFDVRKIAAMAMDAFPSFNPTIGQCESRYDPITREFVALPVNTRPGWERVTAVIYAELAEPALKARYDWSGDSVEALLAALGPRGVALAADRVSTRPTRINPGGEARAYWATAIRVLGKAGGLEHLATLEELAGAVGPADPAISDGCRQAIESIKARVRVDTTPQAHLTEANSAESGQSSTIANETQGQGIA